MCGGRVHRESFVKILFDWSKFLCVYVQMLDVYYTYHNWFCLALTIELHYNFASASIVQNRVLTLSICRSKILATLYSILPRFMASTLTDLPIFWRKKHTTMLYANELVELYLKCNSCNKYAIYSSKCSHYVRAKTAKR